MNAMAIIKHAGLQQVSLSSPRQHFILECKQVPTQLTCIQKKTHFGSLVCLEALERTLVFLTFALMGVGSPLLGDRECAGLRGSGLKEQAWRSEVWGKLLVR
jgi:hypothetical protein